LKIFKKSLSSELISTTGGIFLILVGIVIAQRAAYFIRAVVVGTIPNDAISTLLGLNMVRYLPMILSLAIFLAVLLTLTRWHRDSEMVIWFSSGLGLNTWIKPTLAFATPIIVIISLLSLLVMPWAIHKGEEYIAQLKSRDELSVISPGTFKESKNGDRIYFIEGFDQLGYQVKNIFVQSTQHGKTGIIVSTSGHREKQKNGDNFLVIEHGRRYQSVPNSQEVSTTEFERYAIRMETKEALAPPDKIQSKSTEILLTDKTAANNAELQWRLAIPISAFILVLLAIPLSFTDPRAGRSLNMMFAILIFIVYNNMLSIFQAWIAQNKISVLVGLWPVHLLFLALTVYLFYRRNHLLPLIPRFSRKKCKASV
jgi:lipopolysaccharide export system permease protein